MKRLHAQRLTLAAGERIAPARSNRVARSRVQHRVTIVLALALLLRTAVAHADCAPGGQGGNAPVDEGCSIARPVAIAVAPPAPSDEEGKQELLLAKQLLDRGEAAADDDSRRNAYEAAKQHADRAVQLMPDSADARFAQFGADGRIAQLGGIAVAALQLVKLNKQLDEVLRLDPNHANALAARGGMLMKLPRLLGGNTSKGVEYLERSVALDDTAVGKRLELSEAYHIVGRDDDANTAAESALETAQKIGDPARVASCERFIAELKKTCSGCAVATIGR
jgi:hypothetical protein